jgi:ABC-type amino acid transport system permease subunit
MKRIILLIHHQKFNLILPFYGNLVYALYKLSMLRKEIYLRELHVQHKEIMQSTARGYLTIE